MKNANLVSNFERVAELRLKNVFSNVLKLLNLASHRLEMKNHDFT